MSITYIPKSYLELENLFFKTFHNNNHPAWMFIGNHGVGKAYTALRISNSLLYNNKRELDDNYSVLDNCLNFFHIKSLASSRSGIINKNQIDELVVRSKLTSDADDYKIIVINKLDYLSQSSMNSILTLVEEPPKNWLFIFLVDNYYKILKTISSRCQKLFFPKLTLNECVSILKNTLKNDLNEKEIFKLSSISNNSPGVAKKIHNMTFINVYDKFLMSLGNKLLVNQFSKEFIKNFNNNFDLSWVFNIFCNRIIYLVSTSSIGLNLENFNLFENEKQIIDKLSHKFDNERMSYLNGELKATIYRIEMLNSNASIEIKSFINKFH